MVIPSRPDAPLLRFTRASAFFRLTRSTIASIDGPTAARLSSSVFAARASVPSASALVASPVVRACGGSAPPTMPSADFCAAVRPPCGDLSLESETQRRSPEVRSTAFPARPPDLPPRSLMTVDFAITCSLVRPGRPRYPVLVHRAAALLRASFRLRLATTPLRFANPSPPSGWIEDFHLQAVVHARHTKRMRAGRASSPPCRG